MDTAGVNRFMAKYHTNDAIYHDLMQFKVREILLVATHYDAYILEQEGQLSEKIFEDYFHLNLSSAPRITSVSSGVHAMEKLRTHRYDMVIVMMRIADMTPFKLSREIKEEYPDLRIIMLLKDNAELNLVKQYRDELLFCDNVFVRNGDSKIFLAMVKSIEDRINVAEDTRIGLVRVILLVENSIRYYSRYLPILYSEVIKQTQSLIRTESPIEMKKVLRMRARPKILLAKNFEDAMAIVEKFHLYMLCVISDVEFDKNGKSDSKAGISMSTTGLIIEKKHAVPGMFFQKLRC